MLLALSCLAVALHYGFRNLRIRRLCVARRQYVSVETIVRRFAFFFFAFAIHVGRFHQLSNRSVRILRSTFVSPDNFQPQVHNR
jgi:hypothetical protein